MDTTKTAVVLVITLGLIFTTNGYRRIPDTHALTTAVKRDDVPYVGLGPAGDGTAAVGDGELVEQAYPGHNIFMKQLINYLDMVGKRK